MRLLAYALAAVALAGCGGGDGPSFEGDPPIPDGYTTYRGEGVSFAYPEGWTVEKSSPGVVRMLPPDQWKTPAALVQLVVARGQGEDFEGYLDQTRVVIEEVNDGTIEAEEQVDVSGADEARYARTTTPPGAGNDPVEMRAEHLDVVRGSDVVSLVATAPQRDGEELDTGAVIESFRIDGS